MITLKTDISLFFTYVGIILILYNLCCLKYANLLQDEMLHCTFCGPLTTRIMRDKHDQPLGPHSLHSNMPTYLLVRAFLVNVEATLVHNSRDMGTISKCNINWPKIPVKYGIEYNEKPYRFPIEPNSANRYSMPRKTFNAPHSVTGCQHNHMRHKHTNAGHEIVPFS